MTSTDTSSWRAPALARTPVSRRRVLGSGAALGLGALAGWPASAPAESRPSRGGTLRVGWSDGSSDNTLDPVTYVDSSTYMIAFTLGNCLVELSPAKEPLPELAESWESSDGARRWAFRIRRGVSFHDGRPLRPADVAWSLNRHLAEGSGSSARAFLEGVTRIAADGDEVIVEHATGNADMPVILADFHFVVVPEGFSDWANFVGTGPYVLEAYAPGGRFAATRNPDYWKDGAAWVDRVECRTISDRAARVAALEAGEVDFIDGVDFLTFDRLKATPGFVGQETVGSKYVCSVMDTRAAPFADRNVREALKFSVPRQQIIDKVLGYAIAANDHPIPPTDPFHHDELPQRPFDPDRARFHLREAGLDRLDVTLKAADVAFTGAVDAGVLMADTAGLAGAEITVDPVEADGYWTNVWMAAPFAQAFWFVRPTPGMHFSVAFACGAAWNDSYWCDDRFNELLGLSRTVTEPAERRRILWDLQEIVHRDSGVIIPAFVSDLEVHSDRLGGIRPDSYGRLAGFRLAERAFVA